LAASLLIVGTFVVAGYFVTARAKLARVRPRKLGRSRSWRRHGHAQPRGARYWLSDRHRRGPCLQAAAVWLRSV